MADSLELSDLRIPLPLPPPTPVAVVLAVVVLPVNMDAESIARNVLPRLE